MLHHFLKVDSDDFLVICLIFMNKISLLCHKNQCLYKKLCQTMCFDVKPSNIVMMNIRFDSLIFKNLAINNFSA